MGVLGIEGAGVSVTFELSENGGGGGGILFKIKYKKKNNKFFLIIALHLKLEKPSSVRRFHSEDKSLKAQSRLTRDRRGTLNQVARASRDDTLLKANDNTFRGTGIDGGNADMSLYDTSSESKDVGRFSMRQMLL